MKIKRFFASEMREAIRQVKEELGADAVILSNNKVDGGIELVAAIDYDEEAVKRSVNTEPKTKYASGEQAANQRPAMASQKKPAQEKRKPSIFSRIKKQKVTSRLEDSIEDDVISFSNRHQTEQKQAVKAKDFSSILKQSTSQRASSKNRHSTRGHKKALDSNHNVYSKPSMQDRKQPYISDVSNYTEYDYDDYQENENLGDDTYPFDYESLVNEEMARVQRKDGVHKKNKAWDMDDFYSDGIQQSHKNKKTMTSQTSNKRQNSKKKVEWVQDPALVSMQEEIKSLRGILENQLSGLAWGDFARRHPHRAELLSRLYRLGIKSSLGEKLVKQLKNKNSLEDSWRSLLGIISRNIPMTDCDLIDEGGIIALVGPTGVGKTTNIAKMAARYTLKYGAKNLALVTTDSYRVGAHEQLKTYGRILGVPVYVADDENELKQVLSRLADKQLILIDTAGMSHRDLRLAQQLTMLRQSHDKMKILAVLSAAAQNLAMDEVIKAFNASELDGCIASKIDESTSIGGIISVLMENQLQLNYISDGQKVPEDLHVANATDLLKQALEMVREHPVQIKTDELAMSYSGGGLAHAFV